MDPTLLIGDIVERKTAQPKPVTFDDADISSTGFPAHKKRSRPSAFKQQRQGKKGDDAPAAAGAQARAAHEARFEVDPATQKADFEAAERRRIDRENQSRLENMTPAEIASERAEMLKGLNPALIERLLQRANIDERDGPDPFDVPGTQEASPKPATPEIKIEDTTLPPPRPKPSTTTSKATSSSSPPAPAQQQQHAPINEDRVPSAPPEDLFPINQQPEHTHFPQPPALPDLDPSHPDFLATLHEKFFPNLPADPSKLAWMAPLPTTDSPADRDSPYYPGQASLPISALRFDFRGAMLPPRLSRQIPVSKGLHHHGQAPEAAGYTIEELSILARSAVAAQRCIAFQTIGRIFYRLGKGEWGNSDEDTLARGIWSSVMEGRLMDSLAEAAMKEGGHRGSRAYATEALWLLEKGGWKALLSGR
ncbi:RNA polymerase II associated protein 1 [Verticillium nonalfalfae]|uniref:RNA polymerase II associated protein 1 n=1 Tax=Verticillium nonalfalfae TaxID=1051616 RepID=A0A3M9Y1Y1_9PEZI|nr:RNA polymerase II associated protein 1 [Verticillium nonalfalfae]RNJ54261.1 RNA polymerase II associated protein 1 [Verticillium nonalfalfae]